MFGACVVSVALLVAGCSNGGPANIANRGRCPSTYPAFSRRFSLKVVNQDIHGLGGRLVPFAAQEVRVCRYDPRGGTLSGTAVLNKVVTARLEASTNRLETSASQPTGPLTCHAFETFLLTFTTATDAMDVAVAGCGRGEASNGTLTVEATQAWLDELTAYTAKRP